MSSYIVDQKTIHRIVTHIDRNQRRFSFGCACKQLELLGFDLSSRAGLDALGAALLRMNSEATAARYGKVPSTVAYEYQHERASDFQVLKSLQCLLYQSTEGDVPQTPLYSWLESYRMALLMNIVDGMPEYFTAEWG